MNSIRSVSPVNVASPSMSLSPRVPTALIAATLAAAAFRRHMKTETPTRSAQLRSAMTSGLLLTDAARALLDIDLLLRNGMPRPRPCRRAAHEETRVAEIHAVGGEDDHGTVADVCHSRSVR